MGAPADAATDLVCEPGHARTSQGVEEAGNRLGFSAVGRRLGFELVQDDARRQVELVEEEGVGIDDVDLERIDALVREVGVC